MDHTTVQNPFRLRPRPAGRPRALICFSHLRWTFVWQRPQHLLSRFANDYDVYVVEEPEPAAIASPGDLRIERHGGVTVLTPLLPAASEPKEFDSQTNPAIAR